MAREGARTVGSGLGWLASLVGSVILGVLLSVVRQEIRTGRAPLATGAAHSDCSNRLADLSSQIAAVTASLSASGLPVPEPVEEVQGSGALRWVHRRYEIGAPPALTFDSVKERLEGVGVHDPCVSVAVTPEPSAARVQIGIDGLLTHTLLVRWVTSLPSPVPPPRVAIVIDDLGNDLLIARELTGLEAPITFAVMPFRPFSKEVAELAHLFEREVLLHLPMAAEGGEEFGEGRVLRVSDTEDTVHRLLDEAHAAVPHAVGVSNHMGSRFTRDPQRMGWVLGWMKLQGLFFIDSMTTSESVVPEVAAALGIALSRRSVFLDSVPEEGAVREQLAALLKRAGEQGTGAVGIGHPHAVTVSTLRAVLPEWRESGVEVVRVSTLVAVPTLARE